MFLGIQTKYVPTLDEFWGLNMGFPFLTLTLIHLLFPQSAGQSYKGKFRYDPALYHLLPIFRV